MVQKNHIDDIIWAKHYEWSPKPIAFFSWPFEEHYILCILTSANLVSHCSKPELHTLIADYKPLCCRCSNLLIASAFQDIYIKCALPSSNYNKKSTTIAEVQNSSRSPAENKFSISKGMNTLGVTYKSRGRTHSVEMHSDASLHILQYGFPTSCQREHASCKHVPETST